MKVLIVEDEKAMAKEMCVFFREVILFVRRCLFCRPVPPADGRE